MSRRSRGRRPFNDSLVGRGSYLTSKRSLPQSSSSTLKLFEDRRTFHPEGDLRPAGVLRGPRSRFVVKNVLKRLVNRDIRGPYGIKLAHVNVVPWNVGFERPKDVLICVRRKIRREVLHALHIAGRSGLGSPHYNEFSKVRC